MTAKLTPVSKKLLNCANKSLTCVEQYYQFHKHLLKMSKTANVSFTLLSEMPMKEKKCAALRLHFWWTRGKSTDISSIQYMVRHAEKQHIVCVGEVLGSVCIAHKHTLIYNDYTYTYFTLSSVVVVVFYHQSILISPWQVMISELCIFTNILIQMMSCLAQSIIIL